MKFGWVEVFKGSDIEHFKQIERILCENFIKYRSYELNHSNKLAIVAAQITPQTVSKGPSFNPSGFYNKYSEKNEATIYTIEIRQKDLNKFNSIKFKR